MKHIISADDLTVAEVIELFEQANRFQEEDVKITKQLFAANLFFEPSTRTKSSFLVAERRLNIETLDFIPEVSSVTKGESLYDTVKTFEAIGANILIVRHEADNWAEELLEHLDIPIINAGAGKAEHPTQSLLDAYTVYQEFKTFENLNIVIAGDIKHSRVAHSSIKLLRSLGANIFVSGAEVYKDETLDYPYVTMDEAVELADVLMLLRIQYERHGSSVTKLYNYHQQHGLTIEREKRMKDHAIILHPAPVNRGVEIDTSLVETKRSRIFKQMSNGVLIRMAVLTKLLLNWGIIDEHHLKKCEKGH